jgi:hypothetical protein
LQIYTRRFISLIVKNYTSMNAENTEINDLVLQSTIEKLTNPILDIIKYYPYHEVERRILFFTWAVNIFKPVGAVEVARILGYNYGGVHNLFAKMEKSGLLTHVDDNANYSRVGSEKLPIYVRNDVLVGLPIGGRPPKLYIFKERLEVDMDYFVRCFNRENNKIWKFASSKIFEHVRGLDSSYIDALVDDCLFLCDKIAPVIQMLQDYGTIFIERKPNTADINVRLRNEVVNYKVPRVEPFRRFV